ncbi:HPr family phosphocarrier protein [Cryobacterium sp. HLT2-28]|uniref:HPr family phosphocarrier protein n=1 Tax=Cryobacterium sp. HLT2-28 TaxID=1259146 RepID=UPI00106DC8B0|nr:HPr family phosphocarrier protein [Cryobacterium sp. HLT2-28]TFB91569.1 HPr family phosphocarrier protein [Cryobacterium sp. HLT2-28]
MPQRLATVRSASGLHARPAHVFVSAAKKCGLPITISVGDGEPVDATSILAIMALGADSGTTVMMSAEGENAAAELDRLAMIIETDQDAKG